MMRYGLFASISTTQDYLTDKPEELYLAFLEFFMPETDDFHTEYDDEDPPV